MAVSSGSVLRIALRLCCRGPGTREPAKPLQCLVAPSQQHVLCVPPLWESSRRAGFLSPHGMFSLPSDLPASSSPPNGRSRQGSRGWIRSLCPNSGLLPSPRESPKCRPMGRKDFSVAFLRSITVLSFIKRICSGGAMCRKKPQLPPCPSWSVFFSGNPAQPHFSPRASVHGV